MKSTSVSTKIITILLLLAVIGYFAVQGYNYFVSPETTTLVYRYHSERSIALRGCVVRDEQVVDCNETLIELKHAEGERVGQGDTIASVYRSADALNATQQLETVNLLLSSSVNPAFFRFVFGFFRSISVCATFRSPQKITGFFSSSFFKNWRKSSSHCIRYGSLANSFWEFGV